MDEKKEITVVNFESLPADFSGIEVTDKALAKLKEKYGIVPDCSEKVGYAIAKEGLAVFRALRGKVKARQKELKAGAISYNKRVDTEANRIIDFVLEMEEPMKKARQAEDAAKEKAKELAAEKEKERVAAIEKDINTIRNVVLDCHGKTSLELSGIIGSLEATEIAVDRFAEHTPIAEAAKIEAIERLTELKDQAVETEKADEERKAEDERLVAERDRLRLEGLEAGRISTIKDKIQAIKDRGAYDPEATAEQISGRIHVLENTYTTEDAFQEFQEEAIAAIKGALVALRAFYTMKVEQERVAAIKAEEEAAEATEAAEDIVEEAIEDSKNEEASKHLDNIETAPENQVDTVKTSEDIEFADRMAFVDALVKLFPGVPTPVANNIYYAIEDGKLPNVQLIGGE